MSREYGIRPQDMAHIKPWHLEAMRLHIEALNRG